MELLTLWPEARMEQDEGIPLVELRLAQARREDAGTSAPVHEAAGTAIPVMPMLGGATGGSFDHGPIQSRDTMPTSSADSEMSSEAAQAPAAVPPPPAPPTAATEPSGSSWDQR